MTKKSPEKIPKAYKDFELTSQIFPLSEEEAAFIADEPDSDDKAAKITHIVGRLKITHRRWMRTAAMMPYEDPQRADLVDRAQNFLAAEAQFTEYYYEKYSVVPDLAVKAEFSLIPADQFAHSSDPEIREMGRQMLVGTFEPIQISLPVLA